MLEKVNYSENGRDTFLRNVYNHLQEYMVSQPTFSPQLNSQ
jgi:hypothetical protein